MRLTITAKPKSRRNEVIVDDADPGHLTVRTTQPADKGKANEAVLKQIADHLGIARSRLRIAAGETARTKIVDVADE